VKESFRGEAVGKKVLEAQLMRAGGWENKPRGVGWAKILEVL